VNYVWQCNPAAKDSTKGNEESIQSISDPTDDGNALPEVGFTPDCDFPLRGRTLQMGINLHKFQKFPVVDEQIRAAVVNPKIEIWYFRFRQSGDDGLNPFCQIIV
jgi:hypothetical protein